MARATKTPVKAELAEGVTEVVLVHRLKIRADFIEPGTSVELDAELAAKLEAQGAVRVVNNSST